MDKELNNTPHRRYNILTGEWILVSPHRTKRPWQGKTEENKADKKDNYDPSCYLCPGNTRASGDTNPDYQEPYSFVNDFSSLLPDAPEIKFEKGLLQAESEKGICKVVCFSPDHSLTLPLMEVEDVTKVIEIWKKEYLELGSAEAINYVQIFENKGAIMGCSNPHPHGQIWSQGDIPLEIAKETERQKTYYAIHRRSLLADYLKLELKKNERIVFENDHFVVLVPFWAVWPYETMIISKRHVNSIKLFSEAEKKSLAGAIKVLTTKYDNLFETAFPYSAGMHQTPVNNGYYPEWHWHMHFYPPLLRSATVKKFMVGYEMLANPQRDITPEFAANRLKEMSTIHYKISKTED